MNFSPENAAKKIGNLAKANITENESPVTFLIDKELYGAIPEPYPASSAFPNWYKNIPMFSTDQDGRENKNSYTVRGCRPFMQSLSLGWMLPLPSDLHIIHDKDGVKINFSDIGDISVISTQNMSTYGGEKNIPVDGAVGVKFETPWYISIPKGYSLFNLPLLNRWGSKLYKYFYPFSGIWDADKYVQKVNQISLMSVPENTNDIIKAGTPIAQIAVVHKNAFLYNGEVDILTKEQKSIIQRQETLKNVSSHLYSDHLWEPMKSSRIVQNDNEHAGGCPFSHDEQTNE